MAYAALVSLKTTLKHLLYYSPRIFIVPTFSNIENIENLCSEIDSLLEFLQRKPTLEISSSCSRRERVIADDLERRTVEAVYKLEDGLESHLSSQILSHGDVESYPLRLGIDLQKVVGDIDSFGETVKRIKEDYSTQILELSNDDDDVSSRNDFGRSLLAYDSLVSLMKKIEELRDTYSDAHPSFSFEQLCDPDPYADPYFYLMDRPISPKLELVYKELPSLQLLLERSTSCSGSMISRRRQKVLDSQIREATIEFSHVFECNTEDCYYFRTIYNFGELEQEIDLFTTWVSKIKEEYTTMECSKIIGLRDEMNKLKDRLISDDAHHVVSIVGMVGIGKTTLARQVYEDPVILSHFQRRAWVTIGHKYQFEKIMSALLDQLSPGNGIHDDDISGTWMQQDFNPLYNSLSFKRYLIVFDDIWESEVWHMFKKFFPGNTKGSKIMLTTRREADYSAPTRIAYTHRMQFPWSIYMHKMRFLNNEESWHMFCEKVFAENSCHPELEKAAKKIVQNCEGLPLAIIILAKHLSKSEKTLEYWTNVAEKRIPVFDTADELEVILSSYKYLPLRLKACFLYMGVFPQDSKIIVSNLIKLWCVEGLFEPNPNSSLENTAYQCLEGLVSNSVVMVHKENSYGEAKTFGFHYIFQHLLHSEASKCKFFHVINRYASGLTEAIKGHRRISIHNNVLFGIKDVHKSMVPISTVVRSLLCTGQHHQYPVPMCSGLSLLKVLDALTIRFYNFPLEILQLFRLRYLAFTYNGELPATISKLWDLQYLIVRKHLRIKHGGGAPSYLPMEIWEMKELKHLRVMGCDLPDPCGGSLPNLVTLLDVSFHSCTKEVLKGIPNLRKLVIQIEIPLDVAEPFYWPNDLRHLHVPDDPDDPESLTCINDLESLTCIIVNPNHTSRVVAPLPPFPILPSYLRKLSLSGFGYPWKDLNQIIGSVPFLRILKLRNYAFQGPKWNPSGVKFYFSLDFVLIEDTDLEFLEGSFDDVTHLTLRHCYKLKTISPFFKNLEMIELVDCNPSAAEHAEMIRSSRDFSLSVHFSDDIGKTKKIIVKRSV